MDHITKLYQNRAKVLQEEVNRLEGLLEAMVVAPPIRMSQGVKNEAASNAKADAQAQAAAKAAADVEIKKTEEARKDIEERPILGRIAQTHDDLVNGVYRGVANIKNSPYSDIAKKLGLGAGIYGLLTPRWSINPENAGKITSIFASQAVDQLTGEPIQGIFKKKPEFAGRGWLARAINDRRNTNRLENIVQQTAAAEAAEAAKKAAEETAANQTKEAERLLRVEKQKQTILRMAAAMKEGEIDPQHGLLRRGDTPTGRVTSFQPGGRAKIADYFQSIGEPMEQESIDLLAPKANEPHKYLRSIGAITPEDIAAAGQGVNDLAMTGKEVGRRTAQLARGAIRAAGKGLNMLDPLSLGAEGIVPIAAGAAEVAGGLAMAPLAIGAFTSEAGKGSDIVAPTEYEIKAKEDWAKEQEEQRKQQGLAPVDSVTSPTSAVDAASLGAVTVSQQDRAKLERQAMGAKTSTPNLDRIQKQRQIMQTLQSGPSFFRP
jgi:hypothetical protein